ncbi:MAG: acyl--CoA ligase [Betaproteobacteria bacterium]|nr:acyl--CoA ligase [Betaproteobacteria bacterium]
MPPVAWTVETLLQCIDIHNVSHLACTPMHLRNILDAIGGDRPRLPGLRELRCGASALPVSVLREVWQRISPNLYMNYSTNEAGSLTAAPPELLNRYPDCVGFPVEGIEMEIVDESDRPVAPETLGRIRVRGVGIGPHRMLDATQAGPSAYQGDWYYPGDLGVLNAEGVLFIKGRSDDIMNFDGIMVGPAEIESVLGRHPAVADCAAFPLPSPVHQDIPAAAVVLRQTVSIEELARHCQQHLGIRTPRIIYVIDAIPRNAMGKILRRRLTELALEKGNTGNAAPREAS